MMVHTDLLRRLLPPGVFDSGAPNLSTELAAEGSALDRAHWSADQILLEADPRTCSQTLPDWERVYGLPEAAVIATGINPSVAERRAAVVAKEAMLGGQTKAFFIGLAANLGYAITLTEWRPCSSEMDSEYGVTDEPWEFVWQVNAALNAVRDMTSDDDSEMPLAVWGNVLLEATLTRYKPAHTWVLFSYS
jgi:uncharacterized protein YmfQ (DUF2313 family)